MSGPKTYEPMEQIDGISTAMFLVKIGVLRNFAVIKDFVAVAFTALLRFAIYRSCVKINLTYFELKYYL